MAKESNITRDHIAMEVMKCLIAKAPVEMSLWTAIKGFFTGNHTDVSIAIGVNSIVNLSYKIADAMIIKREEEK